jgi:hypothetical protein
VAAFAFRVTDVFDLSSRSVLLVAGTVLDGVVRPDDVLRDVQSGHSFRLRGIDLVCGRNRAAAGRFALMVDRADRAYAEAGRLWVDAAS